MSLNRIVRSFNIWVQSVHVASSNQLGNVFRQYFFPHFQLDLAYGVQQQQHPRDIVDRDSEDLDDRKRQSSSIFEEFILRMGVPKSKISPGRKRMKHQSYFPDRIEWATCSRCGEAKRPHRICTKHIDICAMRDDEYEAYLKAKGSNESAQ